MKGIEAFGIRVMGVKISLYPLMLAALLAFACLLSIRLSQALSLSFSLWAGYACIRVYDNCRTASFERGVFRVLGTFAMLEVAIILSWILPNIATTVLCTTALIALAVFMACYHRAFSYFFIMFTITAMIYLYALLNHLSKPDAAIDILLYRGIETTLGTFVVFTLVLPFLNKTRPLQIHKFDSFKQLEKAKLRDSFLYMITFLVLTFFVLLVTLPMHQLLLFEQSIIGIIAVMSVFDLKESKNFSISRFGGCFIGLAVALLVSLFVPKANTSLAWILSFIIIMLFTLIMQQPSKSVSYIGAQANLCYFATIYTHLDQVSLVIGFDRLIATLLTLVCIIIVYFAMKFYTRLPGSVEG